MADFFFLCLLGLLTELHIATRGRYALLILFIFFSHTMVGCRWRLVHTDDWIVCFTEGRMSIEDRGFYLIAFCSHEYI